MAAREAEFPTSRLPLSPSFPIFVSSLRRGTVCRPSSGNGSVLSDDIFQTRGLWYRYSVGASGSESRGRCWRCHSRPAGRSRRGRMSRFSRHVRRAKPSRIFGGRRSPVRAFASGVRATAGCRWWPIRNCPVPGSSAAVSRGSRCCGCSASTATVPKPCSRSSGGCPVGMHRRSVSAGGGERSSGCAAL